MKFQQPSPLKPGDKVAIISPSAGMPFVFSHVLILNVLKIFPSTFLSF